MIPFFIPGSPRPLQFGIPFFSSPASVPASTAEEPLPPSPGPVDDWLARHVEPFTTTEGNRLYVACVSFDQAVKARREFGPDVPDPDPLWLINATFARARRVAKETGIDHALLIDAVETMAWTMGHWPVTAKEMDWHGARVSDAERFEFGLRIMITIGESVARSDRRVSVFAPLFTP